MKASDVLKSIADLLDVLHKPDALSQSPDRAIAIQAPEVSQEPAHSDSNASVGVFVPPLQAKLELLKKSVNVDNVYDNKSGGDLDRMKQLSGINVITQSEAADDEPLDV